MAPLRFAALVLAAAGALAASGPQALATPVWLSATDLSTVGQDASDPQVAMDGSGNATAVWVRSNGTNNIIQATTRPVGGSWGLPIDLSVAWQHAYTPQVAMDGSGNATAVWRRSNGTNTIVQAAVRPAGGSWSAPVNLSAAGQDAQEPQVAYDSSGNATAVWRRYDGGNDIVQAATRSAGGSWSSSVDLSAAGQDALFPQIAVDGSGNATAVWTREQGGNRVIQTATRLAGESWGSPVELSGPGAGQDALYPQIAVNESGSSAAVVWTRWNDTNWIVQAATRPPGGSVWGAPIDLSAAGQNALLPQVAIDGEGNATAVWYRSNGTNVVTQGSTHPAEGGWSAAVDVSAEGQDTLNPQLAPDPAGNAIAVWQSAFAVQSAVSPPGGTWSAPVDLSVAGSAENPQVAVDDAGNALAVWRRSNGTNWIIQAAGYDATPPALTSTSIPTAGTAGSPASFTASATDAWSGVASIDWSFGDGQTANGTSVTHVYSAAGTYQVQVTATDEVGNATSASGSVAVQAAGPSPGEPPAGSDTTPPSVRVQGLHNQRRYKARTFRRLAGTAADAGSSVQTVRYALALKVGNAQTQRSSKGDKKRCRFLTTAGSLAKKASSCKRPRYLQAEGTTSWSARLKHRLRRGSYLLFVQATDGAGNESELLEVAFRLS